jgi:hypothetical protein
MEPEIIRTLHKKIIAATEETRTLYELSESDLIVLTSIIIGLPVGAMSASLLGRLLRAAAHFIERNEEIAKEMASTFNKE